ncbi:MULTISPECIES: hypothetical protein [Bradyrhizobium]|uniref:hypothetical protein n=1 Tax=Bradyrhizobium TaxID=374 RepID=UPI000231CB60|nr:hypothetical protein [Bradyrhizobium japonicum]AJA61038.1 hypothetical protein RN69_12150 [Bradyrhizobium japonicum]KMJ99695.1 hypothetical protein CF64_11025 [Bradyrhizobium japonicum]MCS3533937.1 hypothetical protein [Bradyrhizobium japonicum]MCS3989969.1 hypothetical protein [Bradyrhizobium japonicum]MCS4015218.1 hypothetical protein [Bradyrhizobium japonicum]
MSMMANNDARLATVRLTIHAIGDLRDARRLHRVNLGQRLLCVSKNPVLGASSALLDEGLDPETVVAFEDPYFEIERVLTLREATAWRLPGLGVVVPFEKGGVGC